MIEYTIYTNPVVRLVPGRARGARLAFGVESIRIYILGPENRRNSDAIAWLAMTTVQQHGYGAYELRRLS